MRERVCVEVGEWRRRSTSCLTIPDSTAHVLSYA